MPTFTGSSGDDTINGGGEADTINGQGGEDSLYGGGGSDTIVGGSGGDLLSGDDGDDRLYSFIVDPNFNGSTGISYDIYAEVDVLNGGAGDDYIFAGYGDFVNGGGSGSYGDRLYISFLGATSGVQADFRVIQSGGTLTIGGATIQNVQNIGYLEGSNFDDFLVPIDTYYPTGASVYGRGGNDHILAGYYSGWGNGGLYGGDGDDIVDARTAQYMPIVYGEAGNDTLYAASGWSSAYGGDGNDTIYSSATVWGGSGNDTITLSYGYYGTRASGDAGDDVIDASTAGSVTIAGGAGADILTGSSQADTIYSAGVSTTISIQGSYDNGLEQDQIFGGGGDDNIWVGLGDDVDGGAGNDTLLVSLQGATSAVTLSTAGFTPTGAWQLGGATIENVESISAIVGSSFGDSIALGTHASGITIYAGDGNDVISASGSSAMVYGENGDDLFVSGSASDIFDGGAGIDTVSYANSGSGLSITLATGGSATGPGGDALGSVENLIGSSYADTLTGNSSVNDISGGNGNDTLSGGGGNDELSGGTGVDTLTGGAGADRFVDAAASLNGDTITDFGFGDRIIISDANYANFSFSLSGSTLTFTGGSLTLQTGFTGRIVASSAAGGGVELTIADAVRNDFNGDGRSDILWRHASGQMINWLGQANGGFVANADANAGTDWNIASIGDFNGDGRSDILWRNNDGSLTDWLGQSNGSFASNFENAYYQVNTSWAVAGSGDFNGDGRDDILWRHSSGAMINWLGQANGGFVSNADANAGTDWNIVSIADFNGDGRDDILWRNDSGALTNWLGTANGSYASNFGNAYYEVNTNWAVAGAGDFNGDGRDDILWRHTSGQMINWLGQANGGFVSNADANAGTDWNIASIGDFNGDGRDDILWRNDDGALTNWLGQANGSFASNFENAYYVVDTSWSVQPVLDNLV